MYRICNEVITGAVDDDLAAIEPGHPCVSRWNILWSRILRLCVATSRPRYDLKRIVIVIMKLSAPMCFFYQIALFSYTRPKGRIEEKRNAYFVHTDQLLLGKCADENMHIRKNVVLKLEK